MASEQANGAGPGNGLAPAESAGLPPEAQVPEAEVPETAAGAAETGTGDGVGGRRHVHFCPLRWADMDSFGHVNNVVYLRYLEQARVDWMFITAKEAGVEEFSLGTVVARHAIDYKRPLVYRADPVRVETWVTQLGNASFTVAYEVKDDDFVYATAETVLVPYNLSENRPRRITAVERGYLEQYLAPGAVVGRSPAAGRAAERARAARR
ncbi:MAG TPA: thioesterase family protein [Actinocrinis sp.]|nr:thioesterase family protein [Actinocrinis sp.]